MPVSSGIWGRPKKQLKEGRHESTCMFYGRRLEIDWLDIKHIDCFPLHNYQYL